MPGNTATKEITRACSKSRFWRSVCGRSSIPLRLLPTSMLLSLVHFLSNLIVLKNSTVCCPTREEETKPNEKTAKRSKTATKRTT